MKMVSLKQVSIFVIFTLLSLSLFTFELSFVLRNPLTYLLLLALGFQFLIDQYPRSVFSNIVQKHSTPLLFILTLLIVGSIFGRNVNARWGPIDDHEIMGYLTENQKLEFSAIPATVLGSEAGQPGKSLRYRPVYQTLRIVEVALWGNNAQLWYISRLLILTFATVLIWHMLAPKIGFFNSGIFIVYIMTYQMWADMFARLGPSETYTVISLPIYIWGFSTLVHQKIKNEVLSVKAVLAWLIGTLICVGSKENYVLLLIPNTFLSIYFLIKKEKSLFFWVSSIISTVFTFFVAGAFLTAIINTGKDVYGRSITSTSRLSILNTGIRHVEFKKMFIGGIITCLYAVILLFSKKRDSVLFKNTTITFIIIVSCGFIFLTQYVFYNGDWPNHSRYDFPGVLVIPIFYTTFLFFIYTLLKKYDVPKVVTDGLKYGAVAGLIFITIMRGFIAIQVKVDDNIKKTKLYTEGIERISKTLINDPDKIVVIESSNPWDYEPIYAYSRFLHAYGVKNSLHLRIHNYSEQTVAPGLEQQLAKELEKIQKSGGWEYKPLPAELVNCYSILLSAAETECEKL